METKGTFKLTALALAIQLASGTVFAGSEGGKVMMSMSMSKSNIFSLAHPLFR